MFLLDNHRNHSWDYLFAITKIARYSSQCYATLCRYQFLRVLPHCLQALVVVTSPVRQILLYCFALAVRLPVTVGAVDAQKALALRLEHLLGVVFVPAVDEVAVEAVALTQLVHLLANPSLDCRWCTCLTTGQLNRRLALPPPGVAPGVL